MSMADFFDKKIEQYPIFKIEATQGLTIDIFTMECVKCAVKQYEPELLSMPEVERHDKHFDKILSATSTV